MLRTLVAVACTAAAAPVLANVSLGVEATIGAQRLGLQRVPPAGGSRAAMGDLGTTLLLRAGPLGLGVAAEGSFASGSLERYDASLLGGLVLDLLPVLRLELLGEIGAADLRGGGDLGRALAGDGERFHGVRPGLSAKLPFFPLRLGVWGLARWGMPGTSSAPALGLLARVGIEL
jgi:hypothetical protein